MKTGVLLVDDANHIHRSTNRRGMLLGNPSPTSATSARLAPELSRRLYHWRTTGKIDQTADRAGRRRARSDAALHAPGAERRLARADLPRRHFAAVAPRRRIDADLAGPAVRLDRARDPQSAGGDPLFGAAAGRIAKLEPEPTSAWSRSSTTIAGGSTRSSRTSCSCRGANVRGRRRWTSTPGR